jgi:hypothetical protein
MFQVWLSKGTTWDDALRYTRYTYKGIVPVGYKNLLDGELQKQFIKIRGETNV